MSKPISYDPNWQETYQPQILTAAEAVKKIRPGQRIFIGTGVGEPLATGQRLDQARGGIARHRNRASAHLRRRRLTPTANWRSISA